MKNRIYKKLNTNVIVNFKISMIKKKVNLKLYNFYYYLYS